MLNYLLIFLLSALIAFWGLKLFKWIKVLDKPGEDQKQKRKPVPTMQGIFAYIGFVALVGIFFPEYFGNQIFRGLMAWTLPIVIVEFLDELKYIGKIKLNIPVYVRLLIHIFGALLAVRIGGIGMEEWLIWSQKVFIPQWIFVIGFVIWTIICVNAINRFDYANGQAPGVSSVWFITIFLLIQFVVLKNYPNITAENEMVLTLTKNISFILFCFSLLGTIIEFKPWWLMRDVWTMFFGFSLAYLSVVGGTKIGTLVVAISLVIFDAVWVTINRIFFVKKSPAEKDYSHLHHRLIGLWWTRGETRMFVWTWSLAMMILMLIQGGNRTNKVVIFVMMAVIFFGVNGYLFWMKKLPCGLKQKKNENE